MIDSTQLYSSETGLRVDRVPLRFSETVLEDFETTAQLVGRYEPKLPDGELEAFVSSNTTPPVFEVAAAPVGSFRGARPAMSRGAPCLPLGAPCPLTDGRLTPVNFRGGSARITLELPVPMPIRGLVVRGMEASTMPMVTLRFDDDTTASVRANDLWEKYNPWPSRSFSPAATDENGEPQRGVFEDRPKFFELTAEDLEPLVEQRNVKEIELVWNELHSLSEVSVFGQ